MDRLLYIAMTGASQTLRAQAANSHNLANASTTGFRADLTAFQSREVLGSGYPSRVYATGTTVGWDDTPGALISTGRDLDVAVQGPGFIAVMGSDGLEAYTRAGDLRVEPTGLLVNGTGHPVLGDDLYGGSVTVALQLVPPRDVALRNAVRAVNRQMLHARELAFVHPVTGESMHFRCEPPEDFQQVLAALRDAVAQRGE